MHRSLAYPWGWAAGHPLGSAVNCSQRGFPITNPEPNRESRIAYLIDIFEENELLITDKLFTWHLPFTTKRARLDLLGELTVRIKS